ncbi:hypothetical protein [Nostoc sp.]|uniref:hypothetical protein n=1 Tax=Nostoc sp. TaxID=1180 RepID=UPI002FFC4266
MEEIGGSVVSAIAAPATNEAIAYSTQKAMIFSSDSSSLMLFFPLRMRGDGYGGKLRILNFSSLDEGRCLWRNEKRPSHIKLLWPLLCLMLSPNEW